MTGVNKQNSLWCDQGLDGDSASGSGLRWRLDGRLEFGIENKSMEKRVKRGKQLKPPQNVLRLIFFVKI